MYEKDYFEQFRSPQEKQDDEARELHNDGYCKGPPDCFLCQEEKEEAEEIERSKKRPDLLKSFHEAMEWAGLMPKGKVGL